MEDKKVIIKWIDSRQIHGWVLDGEIDDTCCSIESCGFLVRETEDAYVVALSKGEEPVQYNGINVIPKCCVVSIKEISAMSEIHYIEENLPHKTSEVVCLGCLKRWIAVRPMATLLKDLECPQCHKQGYVIETGEIIDIEESF